MLVYTGTYVIGIRGLAVMNMPSVFGQMTASFVGPHGADNWPEEYYQTKYGKICLYICMYVCMYVYIQ
jgi:hypothetical protein